MSSGTVKWVNAQKGYGFIQPDDGSKDVFVHISAVEQAALHGLNDGQSISYDLEQGRQGKTSAVQAAGLLTTRSTPSAQCRAGAFGG